MLRALPGGRARETEATPADKLAQLQALERKVLWLSTWMIHNANHLRPSRDGLKVGGHQASSASAATLMTALYLDVMRPQDRIAVKPHASPLFHALQYLLGQQTRDMLEGWKHDVRNLWWVVDYNRQSLDAVVSDRLFGRIDALFEMFGWRVVTLKYGRLLQAAIARPDGAQLREWIDACPNSLYSALVYKGGQGWREHLRRDLNRYPGIRRILEELNDDALGALMTNLAGHDMEAVLEAFHSITDDIPTCFIAYTIKGFGLPFAGHKDNHAGLMNREQMELFRHAMAIPDGSEWDRFAGLDVAAAELESFLAAVRFNAAGMRRFATPPIPVPARLPVPRAARMSTQEGFGRILNDLAGGDSALAGRIVTTSPDVTASTNLGGWVNRRGLFDRTERQDVFRDEKVVSAQRWLPSPQGQHIELGIAEHNLFLLLAALGLSGSMFGARLLPVGTLYDPFIKRGLDALNYGCYQDSRFMLVATPSGLTLAPEGGAHQSASEPLIGLAQPGLACFEPAFVDELAVLMRWGFEHMQADDGGSVYLRLSTRPLDQRVRQIGESFAADIVAGAYWLVEPHDGAELAIVCCGAVTPEALQAHEALGDVLPGAGLLMVTSPDRLHAEWLASRRGVGRDSHIARLLKPLAPDAALVTVIDAHPATLSWLGGVAQHRINPLGVGRFGQSGDLPDLYRTYGIDADAILDAAARACLER